ncbi:phage antirepressor KilAC domain-containing protein [Peribacillus alkalitolerans]|uniref:phage antirepressor KilAC domain-containing protein n=1 Tax=Peribacillus alkalitolerans TaxID=1550385 RepID=UPI0013D2B085|nr:phage antirepressor KilAC domain-containing protein [Peribacillus alkalitolerans]
MNKLVFIEKNKVVTDSLTVAEVFGKTHDNVLRDIRSQLEKLNEAGEQDWGVLNFEECDYINVSVQGINKNRKYKKFNLSEEAFTIIAFSYITPEAMKFKIKFIQEFKRMREELIRISAPSYSIEDPIKRAERWIEEQRQNQQLEVKTLMLEQQVAEATPKITYYDEILKSDSLVTITQIAKDYGMSGKALNHLLHSEGIQYKQSEQWLLYIKFQDKGYTKSETQKYTKSNGDLGTKLHTKWTQKGRLFIHNILLKLGFEPLMDRESDDS